jgi:nucleotide-binding universal stress UspA family protein
MSPSAPALIAFDGSDEARAAIPVAVALLAGRPLVIATVWEPGLAAVAPMAPTDTMGMPYSMADPREVVAVDRAMEEHATRIAEEGAQLARDAGATAEPVAVADELDAAETLVAMADARGAAVIVVGSRGLSGLRARLHGSTTQKLMRDTCLPVLVVRIDA